MVQDDARFNYEEGPTDQPSNPWTPPSGPSMGDDWEPGGGAESAIAVLLDAGPWILLALAVTFDGPRWLVLVASLLAVGACVSLTVGAVTKRSLAMRLASWPPGQNPARTEYGAAWIELFTLFIIVFLSRAFEYWGNPMTLQLAALASVVAAFSAVTTITTGRSFGRRLLRLAEKL